MITCCACGCRWAASLRRVKLSEQDVDELRRLSLACGGWITWDDALEETWIPLAVWLQRYDPGRAE
jgi:hypothetical protein